MAFCDGFLFFEPNGFKTNEIIFVIRGIGAIASVPNLHEP